jgi:DNA-binding NarL/FixJ family response regulator
MKNTSIVIIEDDDVLRNAYAMLINDVEGFHVVNAYSSFEDASRYIVNDNPTVVMLDIELPGTNGIEAILWLKKKLPKTYVIMLTVYESEEQIFNALSNGASGYLTKNSPIAKIIDSIREVCEGGGPMSTNVARMVIRSFQKNQQSPLSKRETQILEMVGEGKSRSQIANDLFIDAETVKTHLKNVYVKLDVNSKADAIKAARKDKLI